MIQDVGSHEKVSPTEIAIRIEGIKSLDLGRFRHQKMSPVTGTKQITSQKWSIANEGQHLFIQILNLFKLC